MCRARLAYKLAVSIFNLFNYINHYNFSVTEKHEAIKSNMYYLLADKTELINMLKDEIASSSHNDTAKQLLQEVYAF